MWRKAAVAPAASPVAAGQPRKRVSARVSNVTAVERAMRGMGRARAGAIFGCVDAAGRGDTPHACRTAASRVASLVCGWWGAANAEEGQSHVRTYL